MACFHEHTAELADDTKFQSKSHRALGSGEFKTLTTSYSVSPKNATIQIQISALIQTTYW